jgi:hypothetical protein
MADQVMTAASHAANVIPELWSARFVPTLKEKMIFAESVGHDYEGEIQALGDIVNINSWNQFDEADVILENEKASADSTTSSKSQLTINTRVAKDFILTKKAQAQSLEVQNTLSDLAAHSIMKKMQSLIIAAIVPSASAPDHQIAYDSGSTLALADILEAAELLNDSDVEEEGRVLATGSAQYMDLFNITGFTSRDYIPAGSPLTSGAISTPVMGFQHKWSSEAGAVSRFFHPLFLQMAVQQDPDVKEYDLGSEGKRATRVNMDVLFGYVQVSDVRVVEVS